MTAHRLTIVGDAGMLHTRRWALAARDFGWRVRLLTWGTAAALPDIEIHPILDAQQPAPTGPIGAWTAQRQLRSLLKDADLVQAHYLPAGRWLTALSAARHLLLTPWGSDVLPRRGGLTSAQHRWLPGLLRQAPVACLSRYLMVELPRLYGTPITQLHHLPWGADLTLFDPDRFPAPPPEPFTIGFFKHLQPLYGGQVLLEALQLFRHQWTAPWRALLFGEGAQRDELSTRIAELQLQEHISLPGRIPHSELPAHMVQCHVVVSPSIEAESLGVASLEAQSLGIPVINSNLGGMPETCQPDASGLLVPPGEPGALASALLTLARDPARRAAMGTAGRAFVISSGLSWAECTARMDAMQRSLVRS